VTRTAPACPKINQNRNAGLSDNLVEQLRIYLKRFGSGRQGRFTGSASSSIRKALRGHTILLAALFAVFNYWHENSDATTSIRCQRMPFCIMFLQAALRTAANPDLRLVCEICG
jgi:hypothetical protein